MKKILGSILILLFFADPAIAAHLKGGWIQYEYLGTGSAANTSKYRITVRQYLNCSSTPQQRDPEVSLGIFDGASNALLTTVNIPVSGSDRPDKTVFSACLVPTPARGSVCYLIDIYTTTIDLPNNAGGYTLSVQRCCRIANIVNIGRSNDIGVTYSNKIPGIINGTSYANNSSPVFQQKDTVIVCYKAQFTFDFSATDVDGDELTYSFCDGSTGGSSAPGGERPNPPSTPPYAPVPYTNGFSGSSPMGAGVTIDQKTGIISGTAPNITGDYVVAVCASEFRNGVLIGSTKKEIHINVGDCSLSAAELKPSYISCDGYTMSFQNESTNSNVSSYLWSFGTTATINTSTEATPTFTYADTGTYVLKLKVATQGGCEDSSSSLVKIYPGFTPDFTVAGNCYLNGFKFLDATKTTYGTVNSWRWDFGDTSTLTDTAISKDTAWLYGAPANAQVRLIVTNSKGCIDTLTKNVFVTDKPPINLPFKDTLICSVDTLQLRINNTTGTVTWATDNLLSRSRMFNSNTASPSVYPIDTTAYIVTVSDNGCVSRDTVMVNVLDFITVQLRPDSTICKTDSFTLNPISHALRYEWSPANTLNNAFIKNPVATPLTNTVYSVTANLGKCQASAQIAIRVAPYPIVNVSTKDTTICFGDRIQLQASYDATAFSWSPANSLLNANTLTPIAGPNRNTAYILTVSDTLKGCPKSVSDTVLVTVIPPVNAYAGKDTSVVPGQPLQLTATGNGTIFNWRPPTGLNDANIFNPVAILSNNIDSIRYIVRVSTPAGCYAEDDIWVRVYKSDPEIFVPSAFTPNGDGKNDALKPITVGISKIIYFRVFNRWGQLLYTTNELDKGWNGDFNGVKQPSATYIFETEGTNYLGNKVYKKGTTVLIR